MKVQAIIPAAGEGTRLIGLFQNKNVEVANINTFSSLR